jgi:hypothetical protein
MDSESYNVSIHFDLIRQCGKAQDRGAIGSEIKYD